MPTGSGICPMLSPAAPRAVGATASASGGSIVRRIADAIAVRLARVLLRIFFRQIEVVGEEHVPRSGPVVFVANHGNSLIDPFLLVGFLPRLARFLAKSTLWGNPAVRPLLALGGAIPIHRRQDGDTSKNDQTFERCFEELSRGAAVALFPEGLSHDAPALQPLRTGAARIALGAERRHGPLGLRIVPVGLTFDAKDTFRSRVLIKIGAPIDPGRGDDPEAVRALTARIDEALRGVTLNVASWHEARLVARAAEIYGGDTSGRPAPLAAHFDVRRRFGESYEAARDRYPERVQRLERTALRYEGMLMALGLRDDQVIARVPHSEIALRLGNRLPLLALWLPVAALGALLNYVPYRLSGWIASSARGARDLPATYKLLAGFFLTPVAWAVWAGWAALHWGAAAGAAMALVAPASGYLALRFHESDERLWAEVRAWAMLRLRRGKAAELRAMRASLREEIAALVADVQGAPA